MHAHTAQQTCYPQRPHLAPQPSPATHPHLDKLLAVSAGGDQHGVNHAALTVPQCRGRILWGGRVAGVGEHAGWVASCRKAAAASQHRNSPCCPAPTFLLYRCGMPEPSSGMGLVLPITMSSPAGQECMAARSTFISWLNVPGGQALCSGCHQPMSSSGYLRRVCRGARCRHRPACRTCRAARPP